MTIYDIKPAFQKLLNPLIEFCVKAKISANTVTLAALVLSIFGGYIFYQASLKAELLIWIPMILFIRMALNAIDGQIARKAKQESKIGEILNEITDIVSDAVLIYPLIFFTEQSLLSISLVWLFIFLATLTEFCGILSKSISGKRSYAGPFGKSDRAFFIGITCFALYFKPELNQYLNNALTVIAVLLTITCINRTKEAIS